MSGRLLHILDFVPTGTRTFDHMTLAQAARFVAAGWEVRLAFGGEPAAGFARALAELGVGYHVVPMPFTMASRRELNRRLAGYRPTVTLTDFLSAFTPAVLAMKLLGDTGRLVVRDDSSGQPRAGGPLRRAARRWRGRAVGRVLDAQWPVSEFVARRSVCDMGLPAAKVRTIPYGIDPARYPPRERPAAPALRVAYAGQLTRAKGVDTLLGALALLRRAGVPFEARLAGRGPAEPEFRALAVALGLTGVVEFVGHIDSVGELFGWADVAVTPSRWAEAFGLVVAEAMATGAVAVTSTAGGLPGVVADAGLTFPTGDEQALAEVLRGLAADPAERRRLGAAGRQRVLETFRLQDMVETVYEAVVRLAPPARPAVTPGRGPL